MSPTGFNESTNYAWATLSKIQAYVEFRKEVDKWKEASTSTLAESSSTTKFSKTNSATNANQIRERSVKNKSVCLYMDNCTEDCADQINQSICRFLVANALPFQTTESPFFTEMIEALNMAYISRLPKRDKFCTMLLDKLYRSMQEEIDKMWKEQNVTWWIHWTSLEYYRVTTPNNFVTLASVLSHFQYSLPM